MMRREYAGERARFVGGRQYVLRLRPALKIIRQWVTFELRPVGEKLLCQCALVNGMPDVELTE